MSITKNIVANYIGSGWAAVMGIAFIPMYIRYLGMEAYGLVSVFLVLQAWLALLDIGMTPTLNREMARFTGGGYGVQDIQNLLRSLEILCAGVATLTGLTVWVASGYLASEWLKVDRISVQTATQAISVMALVIALRFCEGIYRGSLLGLQRQVLYNVLNAFLATVRHAGALGVIALVSPTIEAFFLWQALVSGLSIAVLRFSVRRSLPASSQRPRFASDSVMKVWAFARGMIGITFLSLMLTQIDKVLLSRLLPLESFGYYALAGTVAAILYLVVSPVTQAIYPRMVQLSNLGEERTLISVYHRGSQLLTVLTAPTMLLIGFFPEGLIFAWSGDTALAGSTAPILAPLALGTFLNCLMWMPYHYQLARGWTGLPLAINLVAVLVLTPCILILVPRYGAVGAAWIWVGLNAAYVLIGIQLMHLRFLVGEKWRWYLVDVALPSVPALAITFLGGALQPTGYDNRWHWLLFLVILGASALTASALSVNLIRSWLIVTLRRFSYGRYS